MDFVLEKLRAALAQVVGYETLQEGTFPTLPLLEATEFGQQHIITTFCLGPPPPHIAAVQLGETHAPAVTLHLILPEGYSYWQPETGTPQYIGGEQELQNLPDAYAQLPAECVPLLAAQLYPLLPLRAYLRLLEQVAENEWLLNKNANPAAEKEVALQLRHHLRQLCEPSLAAYYKARGQALYAWIARATYEKPWAAEALDAVWRTRPAWGGATRQGGTLHAAAPIPAVLDDQPCVVVALYQTATNAAGHTVTYPPHAACYASYPTMEIRWRQLRGVEHFAVFSLPRDASGQPYLSESPLPSPTGHSEPAADSPAYLQLVSLLLEKGWLRPHYPVAAEEPAVLAMQAHLTALANTALSGYYQVETRQVQSWMHSVLANPSR